MPTTNDFRKKYQLIGELTEKLVGGPIAEVQVLMTPIGSFTPFEDMQVEFIIKYRIEESLVEYRHKILLSQWNPDLTTDEHILCAGQLETYHLYQYSKAGEIFGWLRDLGQQVEMMSTQYGVITYTFDGGHTFDFNIKEDELIGGSCESIAKDMIERMEHANDK